mgnify:CR=1 FL=1
MVGLRKPQPALNLVATTRSIVRRMLLTCLTQQLAALDRLMAALNKLGASRAHAGGLGT